jgi:hypothetical protein
MVLITIIQSGFQPTYLKQPTKVDFQSQMDTNVFRRCSNMFASINYMH